VFAWLPSGFRVGFSTVAVAVDGDGDGSDGNDENDEKQ
jgi:hypothetical protein